MLQWFTKPSTTAVLLVAGTVTSALLLWYQNQQLMTAQQHIGAMKTTLDTLSASMTSITNTALKNQKDQAQLLKQLQQVAQSNNQFNQQLQGLKNDVQEVKLWAATLLPADVSRLQQRPAISGADEFRAWLSVRYTMPAATEQPTQK